MVTSEQAQAPSSEGGAELTLGGAPEGGAPQGQVEADGASSPPSGAPQEEDTCSDSSFMSTDDPLSPEEAMAAAVSAKDAGNALFKEGKYDEALQKYKEGESRLKRATAPEAIAVSVQLSSNSCMCCVKLERWQQAIEAANKVLSKEPQNLKALYRRAVARSNLGKLQEAKDDLMAVLGVDRANADARKELQKVKEKIQAAKAEDKKAYSGLFSRASGLYDDREAEREKKKKEEEIEKARRRADWEAEMQARKEKGEDEEDFETWLRKTKEAEEKEREQKQKQQAKLESPTGGLKRRSSKESPSSSSSSSSSSLMEVDEEDAAIISETKKMGYCYFRRDLTEEEKKLNAQNKPTKIASEPAQSPHSDTSSNKDLDKGGEAKSISQWNAKGTTYEEKDVSPWARSRFAERLREAATCDGSPAAASPDALLAACMKATEALGKKEPQDDKALQELMKNCFSTKVETRSVEDVSGDAHLAVVRGSRRVFFDLKCQLKIEVTCSSAGPLSLPSGKDLGGYQSQGTLKLPEVSSADGSGMSWLEGSSLHLDSPPPPHFKPMVDEAVAKYKEAVAEKIQAFLDDCKALP
ncbi:hypothetical protein Efla_002328 [Eimeria flavescens]